MRFRIFMLVLAVVIFTGDQHVKSQTNGSHNRFDLVEKTGNIRKPSDYRDGQNTIRDSETGALVYLPPEARDVPGLMAGLVAWVRSVGRIHYLGFLILQFLAHHLQISALRRARFSPQPGLRPRSRRRLNPPLQAEACSTRSVFNVLGASYTAEKRGHKT